MLNPMCHVKTHVVSCHFISHVMLNTLLMSLMLYVKSPFMLMCSQVFSASNVHLITKTRTEHLTDQDKKRTKKVNRTPLESFLGVAEDEDKLQGSATNGVGHPLLISRLCQFFSSSVLLWTGNPNPVFHNPETITLKL